ncbi:hypothetical protein CMK13_12950 [Candidatus Poribacteria bacterium]|nr:hypothetical protein [Candidatus Poribacteria bacterium]OUT58938.1 MAG: hypothetical protein CBB75_12410 [bacterium TMED15]
MSNKKIVVSANEHHRNGCPVIANIEPISGINDGPVILTEPNGQKIFGQYELLQDEGELCWVLDDLPAHTTRTYQLSQPDSSMTPAGVSFTEKDQTIVVDIDDRHFTTFRYDTNQYRPYFFPVLGPNGCQVTRGEVSHESKDHVHHRSLYVAYGEVNHSDLWSEGHQAGRIVHKSFSQKLEGVVCGKIYTRNSWHDKDGIPIMSDIQNYRLYALPAGRSIIDLDLTFLADQGDVFFGDTKEGGIITVRVNPQMNASNPNGKIENSFGGINEDETWGKKAHWCDYSGIVDGVPVGVSLFDHLSNPRYPTYWHVRNYGLMGSNIFGGGTFESDERNDGSYTLHKGQEMNFRFRVYIHYGDANEGKVGQHYHDFINPPSVVIE